MAPTLCILPAEIIELIAAFLEGNSLLAIRLVCKGLNQKTIHQFGQVSFATVRTDFSPSSLHKVLSLASHPAFKRHVKCILLKRGSSGADFGLGFHWPRHSTGCLDPPLPLVLEPLKEALLMKLVNCRSFHIQSVYGVEDPPSADRLMPTDVVGISLAMIAATGIPLESFIIDFVSQNIGRLDPCRLQPAASFQTPNFLRGWENLQELGLRYSMHHADTSTWAMGFVLHARNLSKLHLEFEEDHSEAFIRQLNSLPYLPPLQELNLYSMRLEKALLISLMSKFASSLVKLSLHYIFLTASPWTPFLEDLGTVLPLLGSISLNRLAWMTDGADGGIFFGYFESLPETTPISLSAQHFSVTIQKQKGAWSAVGVDYEGPQMGAALKIIGDSLTGTEI